MTSLIDYIKGVHSNSKPTRKNAAGYSEDEENVPFDEMDSETFVNLEKDDDSSILSFKNSIQGYNPIVAARKNKTLSALRRAGQKKVNLNSDPIDFEMSDYTVIGEFICTNKGFENELTYLISLMEDYAARSHIRKPLNIALIAKPGSGKSFLIKQISKKLNSLQQTIRLKFNAASSYNIEDLRNLFTEIKKNVKNDLVPIAFIDEVDSKISGEQIYEKLLSPMADGEFFANGLSVELGKCILITAASSKWDPGEDFEVIDPDLIDYNVWKELKIKRLLKYKESLHGKLQDFIDRVDCWLILPPIGIKFSDTEHYEEYLDAIVMTLIHKHCDTVREIEYVIVKILSALLKHGVGIRAIEQIVFQSKYDSNGIFKYSMMPKMNQNQFDEDKKHYEEQLSNIGKNIDTTFKIVEWNRP